MVAIGAARPGQRSGLSPFAATPGARYRLAVAALLVAGLVVAGGASRADEPRQMLVRLVALAVLAATAWPLERPRLRFGKGWRYAAALTYLLVLVQLLPVPPELWARLPGHTVYADIAATSGATAWRPLSLTPDLTVNALLALLPATAAALCFAYLDGRGRARVWLWLCGAAVLSALLGVLQLAAGGDAFRFYRETSPDSAVGIFANRNHQAAFLACALPLVGAVAGLRTIERPSRHWLWLAVATAAVLELGILATASRSGLVLGALGLAAAIWSFRASGAAWDVAEGRSRALLLAGGFMAAVAAVFAATRLGVVDRLAHTDPVGEMRFQMIAPLTETVRAFFPWGSGFGSFETVYRQFEPDALLSTIYMNQAHNELLQLAIEGGLPALLLLASFLWWWSTTALRIVRGDVSPARRGTALAAIAISAMLLAESLVDYPLRTPLLGSLFVIACVEMIRARSTARPARRNGLRQN